jgi:hypothetical protein
VAFLFIEFLKSEMKEWLAEDKRNKITNDKLHELVHLGRWMSDRARNYIQTRQKDVEAHLGIPREWHVWFNDKRNEDLKALKSNAHKQFQGLIWTDASVSIH